MNRSCFSFFVLLLIVFGMFTACKQPVNPMNNPSANTPPKNFTISFNANSGTPAPKAQTVSEGGKVTEPPAMSRSGYGFGGWYKEATFINLWNFSTSTVSGNITLYAKWDTNFYTVNFMANGGTPAPGPQNIAHNGKVIQPPAMTKTGYTFDSWYKEAALTNKWNFASNTVTGTTTLHAKWIENCTVTFEANGGSPVPPQQSIAYGGKVTRQPVISKDGFSLEGWYKESEFISIWNFDNNVITENITLYAKWVPPILVPGANFSAKIRWLESNVQSNGNYVIEVDADQSISRQTLSYAGKNNIIITLIGVETNRIIYLSSDGSVFTVGSGVTLILDNKLELRGRRDNSDSLIHINNGGSLILNGAKITGNSLYAYGGGVYVAGTFTMNGGKISGNTSSNGGGGVYVHSGPFIMNGGEISGNITSSSYNGYGGGVYTNGTFIMNGGEISGNTSSSNGGGVYVEYWYGLFTMNNGVISGNATSTDGGGVFVGAGFTMNDGVISGNTSSINGGGVSVEGRFYIYGGEISGNTSFNLGGGVFIKGRFTKTGGTIFGYSNGNSDSNVVKNNSGVVQQNRGHAIQTYYENSIYIMGKDTTSGPEDDMLFSGGTNPPSFSGEWDY